MDFEVSSELVAIYLEDAREHLAFLDRTLLALEKDGHHGETASSLLGPLHTLKGNSGMMGFTHVKDYVHRLEEVMARARDGALVLDGPAVDRLLAGAAALRDAVETACVAGAEQRDLAPEEASLAELLVPATAAGAPPPARPATPVPSARSTPAAAASAAALATAPAATAPAADRRCRRRGRHRRRDGALEHGARRLRQARPAPEPRRRADRPPHQARRPRPADRGHGARGGP